MVKRTTHWPEVVPLSSTRSADVARAFICAWIARFGASSDISDQGPQFTSELWGAVTQGLRVKLHHTTVYHPQANGLCEWFHRSMKVALRARPPYDRPFRILEPGDKTFVVDVGSKPDHISMDRLKPAHLDLDRPVKLAQALRRVVLLLLHPRPAPTTQGSSCPCTGLLDLLRPYSPGPSAADIASEFWGGACGVYHIGTGT
ncbi:hypothetical protein AAFF_G00143480 [Aldrovandia affinis]|uniref:Integrase catalytic domain-containing protein n=1 Tax=Aldrovandia affinis TaxID=143900 RepID=A0AAD7T0E1_9TELE|nr:hypothetical protein AAFF_G00143480 [Aldrovandia affinis]